MRFKNHNLPSRTRRGFTLVELLVVISIIGMLSTIATVSYTSARMKARDARRLADMDVVRSALALYEIDDGGFPADKTQGAGGLILGKAGATELNAAGWADIGVKGAGSLYLEGVPSNPSGGGVDYLYYSLNQDSSDCDFAPCFNYRVEYALEAPIAGQLAGAYILTPGGGLPAPAELAKKILAREKQSPVDSATSRLLPVIGQALITADNARLATIGNPAVQQAAQTIVAPVSTAAVAVSTVTGLSTISITGTAVTSAISGASAVETAATTTATAATAASAVGQLGSLIFLLFTQPFMLLRKRKEYAWGIVYDSQKKLPLDLVTVRLIDDATGRVMQTRVTDRAGRIFFFIGQGVYRIEATKPGFVFPSALLSGEAEDGHFANLYFGQKFSVSGDGQVINPSIPLDPVGVDLDDREFVKRFVRGRLSNGVSIAGLVLTMAAFAIKPTVPVAGLFVLNLLLHYVFRRLSYPKPPAEWGIVKDEKTGRPVSHAVIRLFSSPYNKLVETKVTDGKGRYNFLVGQNVYFLTATSKGYWKTESFPLDLRGSDKPQIISAPVRLRPLGNEAENRVMDEPSPNR